MRTTLTFLLIGASMLFATLHGVASSPKQPAFSITIGMEKPSLKAGSDVWIKITLTNTSDHDIDCSSAYVNGVDRRYQYDVRDNTGLSMQKKTEHPELVPGSIQLCTLKPGESTTEESRISWLHDLSRPGKYTVQVSRGVSDNEKDGVVKSNTTAVTVAE